MTDHSRWLDISELKDNLGERTLRAGKFTTVAQGLIGVADIAATLVLARLITPNDFGLIGMVIAITGFIALFKDLGLSMATVQRENITQPEVSALFWVNSAAGVGLSVVTAALAPAIAWFYDKPELIPITLALSVAFAVGGLGIQHQALLTRQMYFGRRAGVEFVASLGSLGVAIALGVMGYGYWALVARAIASPVLLSVGFWVVCSWKPSRPRRAKGVGELLKFGGNLTGFSLVNYFSRNLDDVLIGKLFGEQVLGVYQEGYKVFMAPLKQLNAPVGSVAIPALSRLLDKPETYRSSYRRLLELLLLITMPLGALVVSCPDWLVYVVLGDQWVDTGPILFWLGFLVFTQPISNSAGWLFITQDRADHMLKWGVIGSSLAMISFVAGLPWGAVGVAASYSVSGILIRTPILFWMVGSRGPVRTRDLYQTAMAPIIGGLLALVVLLYLRTLPIEINTYVGAVAALITAYLVSFMGLGLTPSGRNALKSAWSLIGEVRAGTLKSG